jgi:hypothetical protein
MTLAAVGSAPPLDGGKKIALEGSPSLAFEV